VVRWLLDFRRDVLLPISRWQLAVALGLWLIVACAGWLLGAAYIAQFRAEREHAVLARATVAAEALEQTLLRSLEAVQGIQALTQTRESLLAADDLAGAAAIADHLHNLTVTEAFGVLQVSVIGADGWMTWSTTPVDAPVWLGDREHFLVHKSGRLDLFVSAPLVGRASGRWSVQMTAPLVSRQGTFAGVSVVSFDPLRLSNTLAKLTFGTGGVSAVMRLPDGHLIARNEQAGTQIARPPNPNHPVVLAALKAPMGTMRYSSVVDGRSLLLAYRVVGSLPLVVSVGLDAQVELADVRSLATSVHALALAGALLALALLAMAAQRGARRRQWLELERTRDQATASELARRHTANLLSGLPAAVYSATITDAGDVVSFELTENAHRLIGQTMTGNNTKGQTATGQTATGDTIAGLTTRPGWTAQIEDLDETAWKKHFQRVLRHGEATVEYRFPAKAGTELWLRDQARVYQRLQAGTALVVGYISDITNERDLRAQAIASAKLATLGEMATGLAHELNQPIAIMSLAAENSVQALSRKGADGIEFAVKRLQRITDQCHRARTIVDHLRIFGRSDEGEVGPVSVESVIEGALTLVGGALRAANIDLEIVIPRDPPEILARAVLAEQVIVNLMLNARDAMDDLPSGHRRALRASVTPNRGAGTISIEVADSGPGIAPTVLDRIFEPFFTTKEVGKGTGLGLSICHGIMRSFGGSIVARNGVDGGAVFAAVFREASAAGPAREFEMTEKQPA